VTAPHAVTGFGRQAVRVGQLSDLGVVVVAVGTALGAWAARPVPVWPIATVAIVALALRRPMLLGAAVTLLASGLSAQAWLGVRAVPPGPWSGRATLITDPERLAGAVHAEVRAGGHHLDLWARGRAGASLSGRSAPAPGDSPPVGGAPKRRSTSDRRSTKVDSRACAISRHLTVRRF